MSSPTSSTSNQQQSWIDSFKAYLDRRAIIMLFLGFAAGVPILLIFSSLSLWLREAGVDKSTVTMFSWAALGYSFKFIWAPLVDALPVPVLTKMFGRRRSWMLVAQLGVIGAILLMGSINPVDQSLLTYMALGAVLLGFSSATQDIVIDAYRIELAPPAMQPILSANYIAGYRVGMVVAGAGALYLAEGFGSTKELYNYEAWRNTYYIMAGVMGVALLTTLTAHEPNTESLEPKKLARNQKYMAIYASTLIPVLIVGIIYFIGRLGQIFFESDTIYTFALSFLPIFLKYITVVSVILPLALVYILLQQPKFKVQEQLTKTADTSDKVRLFGVFVLSVIGFVLAYKGMGVILPEVEGSLAKFAVGSTHMLSSLAMAFVTGFILVKIGLVNKEVAKTTWVEPINDFFDRYGKKALLLLALIGLYRISDIVAGVISNVFYQDMEFTKGQIADAVKTMGVLVSIFGGLLGGLLAQRMRIMRAMMIGGVLACVSNLLFILLAQHAGEVNYLYMAVVLDNLAAGLASAVFVAFLSALTSIRFTAVQYAIFSSLMTLLPKVLGGYSGSIVEDRGYEFFFGFTFAIGIPILLLVWLVDKYLDVGEPQIGD